MYKFSRRISPHHVCRLLSEIKYGPDADTGGAGLNAHVRKCNRGVTGIEGLVNVLKRVFKMFYRCFKGLLQHILTEARVYSRSALLADTLVFNTAGRPD